MELVVVKSVNKIKKMNFSGHAFYSDYGQDICCAAISTALMMTLNGIDVFGEKANIQIVIDESKTLVVIIVLNLQAPIVQKFLQLLWNHLKELQKQFPKQIKIKEN